MDSGASAVWCMRKSPDGEHLAVGGEDGIVRIYEIMDTKTEMCLLYLKSFERQDKRVLSLSWHSKGNVSYGKDVVSQPYLQFKVQYTVFFTTIIVFSFFVRQEYPLSGSGTWKPAECIVNSQFQK